MDRTHNPEFTVMEIYVAYKDYHWMMDFTEEMIERVAKDVCGTTTIKVGENEINLARPFKRISMRDAILKYTGFDILGKSEEELRAACKSMGIEVNETMGKVNLSMRYLVKSAKGILSSRPSSRIIRLRCLRCVKSIATIPN
jgi:lysyl-tRNA synthetase, class II